MKIGNRLFDTQNQTYIMGILNITPDSFSDGGKWNHMDEALKHTETMIADGADIIDIGGESTRPGHTPVSADEEVQRVLPVIEAVRQNLNNPVNALSRLIKSKQSPKFQKISETVLCSVISQYIYIEKYSSDHETILLSGSCE